MTSATAELVRLIDLSLGSQPSGVVNFNYLHTLMHAIVNRLGTMEHVQSSYLGSEGGDVTPDGGAAEGTGTGATGTGVEGTEPGGGISGGDGADGPSGTREGEKEGIDGTGSGEQTKKEPSKGIDGTGSVEQTKKEPSTTTTPAAPPPTSDLAESKISTTSSGRTSRAGIHSMADGVPHHHYQHRPRSSFVTAANDLGAMERKLQEFESRLNAMDTLPELLERKSSDMGATPIKDRWNFTNLSKRLSATEDGLEQVYM